MSLQKKLLAVMVGATLSFSASANVDLGVTPPEKFLNSIAGAATNAGNGSDLYRTSTDCSAKVDIPFGYSLGSSGSSKYIVLQLTGATFTNAFNASDVAKTGVNFSVSSGGAPGSNQVILEAVASVGTPVAASDKYTFDLAGATGITLDGSSPVSVTSTIYQEPIHAEAGTNALGGKTGPVIELVDHGIEFTLTPVKSERIDIADPKKFEDRDGTTPLAVDKSPIAEISALNYTACNAYLSTAKPTVADLLVTADPSGGFKAFKTPGQVVIDPACNPLTSVPIAGTATAATSVDDNTAQFNNVNPPAKLKGKLCLDPSGNDPMIETAFNCKLTVKGGSFPGAGVVLYDDACGSLQFAGSSDHVNFSTTPTSISPSAYKQYFRITNPSSTKGKVFVTVINDDGDRETFPMGDVAAIGKSELEAGASTKLFSGDDLYAAAQSHGLTVKDVGSEKYRVIVRGQFGKNALDGHKAAPLTLLGVETESAIIIESFHISKSGDLLNQVK
ncbi:MAG: hypothetical protein CR991_03110 [Proteobacteria bacterium]|nr:MAG: hypothetical protein CR991_03110 [Pseudomonadota bacterium]